MPIIDHDKTIESDEFLAPATRASQGGIFDRRGGRQMGRHHPLRISGHVGRFDVVPTPQRRRKRSKTGATRGRTRTRERGKVTRLRQVHDGGEVRETRTWRDAKWSETRLSFSPGRAVSWTDGEGKGEGRGWKPLDTAKVDGKNV